MSSRESRPRHQVTVTIAGEKHVLRSDVSPEYTQAVASHVDRTVHGLSGARSLEPHRATLLAALVITDELFRARDEVRGLRSLLEQQAAGLAERLEQATSGGNPFTVVEALEPPELPEPPEPLQ
jgi:cell division protein ZapA (FtsZ GTPase activity inhibitor)